MLRYRVWRRLILTLVGVGGFVLLYEATVTDSRSAARQAQAREATALPSPGARLQFNATAYCKGTTTTSGVQARSGVAAADSDLLPVGTVIQLDSGYKNYDGIYTIMDTGPRVQGRLLDIYMWNCHEALAFGRRTVRVTVLRLGWNPRASTPSLVDSLFRRREPAVETLPTRPFPLGTELPK
jgi:3D (Asp-Asp-Asp) domain-containing protein